MANEDIKIEQPNTKADNFTFFVGCTITLSKKDIWPDGDHPDHPTSSEVLWQINKRCGGLSVSKLIGDYSLPVKVVIRPK